jgi:glycosyltransferase involved in cell wall biosynthesis
MHISSTEGLPVTDLSVVLISKNQEWNIARLIESVLERTSCVPSREIVLVDSASTDRTIDIALDYSIDILRLRADQRLTPAAGRYVGYKYTSGDLVLFLDGDMELCNGWLEEALAVMQSRPDVAVVTGPWIDLPLTALPSDKVSFHQERYDHAGEKASRLGGAAMYRRAVLKQVGTFNPWLYSDEEPELCLRIRYVGYRVFGLECSVAYHYSDSSRALSTLVARWRRNLYLGFGQSIRYHFGGALLWPYLRERGYALVPALGLAVGLVAFLWSLVGGDWTWFRLWVLLVVAMVGGHACRNRSLYRAIYSLVHRVVIIDGTVRGFFLTPLDPDSYPGRVDVIKRSNKVWGKTG